MITNVQIVTVPVRDQQQALEFYTEKLGFEVLTDQQFGEGMRWLEVAPKGADTRFSLTTPPGFEERIGTFTGIVVTSDDVRKTAEEMKSRGVTFTQEPEDQPWGGTMGQFVDQDGNGFVLHSRENR